MRNLVSFISRMNILVWILGIFVGHALLYLLLGLSFELLRFSGRLLGNVLGRFLDLVLYVARGLLQGRGRFGRFLILRGGRRWFLLLAATGQKQCHSWQDHPTTSQTTQFHFHGTPFVRVLVC